MRHGGGERERRRWRRGYVMGACACGVNEMTSCDGSDPMMVRTRQRCGDVALSRVRTTSV